MMDMIFKVLNIFQTSIGMIVILKSPNPDIFLIKGTVLKNGGGSKWKVIAAGMGKRPNLNSEGDDWRLIQDYKIEIFSGPNFLNEGDILYVENN